MQRISNSPASEILLNAPAEATIDLIVAPPLTPPLAEYEQLLVALHPLLQGAQVATLTEKKITALAEKADIERERLKLLRQSAKLARKAGLSAEVFYGLARQNWPLKLNELLARPVGELRQALETALQQRIVSPSLGGSLAEILARFEQLRLEQGIPSAPPAAEQPLDQAAGAPEVSTAYADLNRLSLAAPAMAALVEHGYDSVAAIADVARAEFVRAVGERIGESEAARLHATARAQTQVLDNILAGIAVDRANGLPLPASLAELADVLPEPAPCRDCEAAVSPRAYLADLLSLHP